MERERHASAVAATIAALFTAVTIRHASFAATISDGSGYVSEASRWLSGNLIGPQPFALWLEWPIAATQPFGYTLGLIPGTDVFTYPPGLPMTMAAAISIGGGELAAHLVPPVLGGALVWATGDLAARIAGARARVIGAALMATSAIALALAQEPMTDVPAAAWWALSLVLVLRGRAFPAFAAGLAAAMAILTRPNLMPLVLVPAALAFYAAPAARLFRGSLVAGAAAIGLVVLLYMQYVLYGSAWTTGHLGIQHAFAFANIRGNAWEYIRWYYDTHTPVVLVAVLAPILFWRGDQHGYPANGVPPRCLVVALLIVVVAVYAAYVAYIPVTDWGFVRFLLPALAPLYALTAAVLSRAIDLAPRVAQVPMLVTVILLTAGMQVRQAHAKDVSSAEKEARRVPLAGRYLDAALPTNAIVVTAFHSGSIRHYTGRPILRPELVAPEQFDATLDRLARSGCKPYLLIDEGLERAGFLARFPQSRFGALDWPPRAQIGGERGRIHLYDLADRERHLRGEQWPIDILQ